MPLQSKNQGNNSSLYLWAYDVAGLLCNADLKST